ncbi:MAG: gas vesicle protein GvpG [Actinomycetota bacterium]|nr:gas vesicle protein GvpG [Actinomycetota bacterium]
MSKQRATFSKRQREGDKQAKAAAKRERRATRDNESPVPESTEAYDQERVLAALAGLHQAYEDGEVSLEDFEARRDELRDRLRVD